MQALHAALAEESRWSLQNAYNLPNVPGTDNGTLSNFRTIRNDIRHFNTFDARLDYAASGKDRAFARFTYDNSDFTRTSRHSRPSTSAHS